MKFAIVITLDAYKRFKSEDIHAARHEMFIEIGGLFVGQPGMAAI